MFFNYYYYIFFLFSVSKSGFLTPFLTYFAEKQHKQIISMLLFF